MKLPQNPEEFLAKAKVERKLISPGADKRTVAKILRLLAPVYGYTPQDVARAWDSCTDEDLLRTLRQNPQFGAAVPEGLIIGGHTGLKYADLLHLKFREKQWWLKFRQHMEIHGEVIWILPMQSNGYWVIHNINVSPRLQQPAILIPARSAGLNHVRAMRLELFIEEHPYE